MLTPIERLDRWKSGDAITKERMNQIVRALQILGAVTPPRQEVHSVYPNRATSDRAGLRLMGAPILWHRRRADDPIPKFVVREWESGDEISAERLNMIVDGVRTVSGAGDTAAQSTFGVSSIDVSSGNPMPPAVNAEPDPCYRGALDDWSPGESLSNEKLNQPIDILNALHGIEPPKQMIPV